MRGWMLWSDIDYQITVSFTATSSNMVSNRVIYGLTEMDIYNFIMLIGSS